MSQLAKFRVSLKLRVALMMVGITLAFGGGNRVYVEYRLVDEMERVFEDRAVALARYLAAESAEPIRHHDLVGLESLLTNSKRTGDDFVYAFVVDRTPQILAHTFAGDFPDALRYLTRYAGTSGHSVERIDVLGFQHRDVAVPIHRGELGVLHLGFRGEAVSTRLEDIRRDLILLLAMIAAVGAVAAYAVIYRWLKPLDSIVTALEKFEPGRRRVEIPVVRHDEIGDVAQRVNQITDRMHRAQAELMRAGKMAELGRVAAVVAHEVGNPLASLTTRLALMQRSDDQSFVRESLPVLATQIARIQRIVQGLSQLSRSRGASPTPCYVNGIVDEVIDLLRFDPRSEGGRLSTDLAQVPPCRCVHDQLVQVLVNLTMNGIQASAPRGDVSLRTYSDNGHVCIEITDSGPGVPPGHEEKIFEPFFSTKDGSSGLGLAVSRNLMRRNGGEIRLEPNGGPGARFIVCLPLANKGPAAADTA